MKKLNISIINHSENPLPVYQTDGSAGMDLAAWLPAGSITMASLERKLIPTGLFLSIPVGYEAQIRPRSGMAFKKGLTIVNAPGTIDSDYRGEIMVAMINLSKEAQTIQSGDRIAQMILAQHETVQWTEASSLEATERSAGGFGHTG